MCFHQAFNQSSCATPNVQAGGQTSAGKMRRTVVTRIVEAAKAIGLCHNVTPIIDRNQIVGFILYHFINSLNKTNYDCR